MLACLGMTEVFAADDVAAAAPAVGSEQLQKMSPEAAPLAADQNTAPRSPARADRLELDTTIVTGNRELPKVLYIVPWKKAQLGDLPAQPFNTLLDEVLTPVDRDVFRREVTYFEALANGSSTAPANSPEAPGGSEK